MRSRRRIWHLMLLVAVAAVGLAGTNPLLVWLSAPPPPHIHPLSKINVARWRRRLPDPKPHPHRRTMIYSSVIPVPRSTPGGPDTKEMPPAPKAHVGVP